MKIGDIVYYVDKEMQFYYDLEIVDIIKDKVYNILLYKCKILGNKYKFLNNQFKFYNDRIGEISTYSELNLCKTLEEAEKIINK